MEMKKTTERYWINGKEVDSATYNAALDGMNEAAAPFVCPESVSGFEDNEPSENEAWDAKHSKYVGDAYDSLCDENTEVIGYAGLFKKYNDLVDENVALKERIAELEEILDELMPEETVDDEECPVCTVLRNVAEGYNSIIERLDSIDKKLDCRNK